MTRGPSGRIVVEFDVDLKRSLYACLVREGKTLKGWFAEQAYQYVREHGGQFGVAILKPTEEQDVEMEPKGVLG